jgi:hypothetical protein
MDTEALEQGNDVVTNRVFVFQATLRVVLSKVLHDRVSGNVASSREEIDVGLIEKLLQWV